MVGSGLGAISQSMRAIVDFWRGDLPLSRAFWRWGIVGGAVVGLFCTVLALVLLTAGAPGWLAAMVFSAHIPWNLVLFVGVWRSTERAEVDRGTAHLVRLTILVWVIALTLL